MIGASIELPTVRIIPATRTPLTGVYVEYHGEPQRQARIERAVVPEDFIIRLPDDWLCLDDLQAIADYVAITEGRPIAAMTMRHELRRNVLILYEQDKRACGRSLSGCVSGELPLLSDATYAPRVITVRLEQRS